ncbi:MAG: hypothetical protein PHO19_02565 [Candidatus Pacebacteria bacterium]|jgi:hypothetical protein|nr:hypothetical protein [Candidatus Paceibacterota bacterium]
MVKEILIVSGLILIIAGALGLMPAYAMFVQSSWYAILEIVIGLIAIGVASSEKKT